MARGHHVPDLTGKTFGHLLILSQQIMEHNGRKQSMCFCHCSCGNELWISASRFRGSRCVQSCGCVARERSKSLVGETFGRLEVLSAVGRSKSGDKLYRCRCICGNQITVPACSLRNGSTKSCGCLRESEEYKAKQLDAAQKGIQTIQESPELRAKCAKARYATKELIDGNRKHLKEERAKTFIQGVNVAAVAKKDANASNVTTGVRGVCWSASKQQYIAYAQINGIKWRRNGFETVEAAAKARIDAKAELMDRLRAEKPDVANRVEELEIKAENKLREP